MTMDSMQLRALLYAAGLLACLLVLGRSRSRTVRQGALLAVSYALYLTWGSWFVIVLLASTAMNFLLGRWMRRDGSLRVLWTGLAFNLALLAFFKYLPGVTVSLPFASLQKFSHIALPLGISFWTFQAMSYLLDLYRGEELDPTFASSRCTWRSSRSRCPDQSAGCRTCSSSFAPSSGLRVEDMGRGVCRIATGLLMMQVAQLLGKGIIAGQGINAGFDQMRQLGRRGCLVPRHRLRAPIFFDFAGYSHIAIGAARMMGFTVPENFARPYASTTPSVFWTRWHMSLSFWIRDYLFLPLAVLRREDWWRKFCLLLSMVVFGIWHGATFLFVLFGCYHGVLLILHRQVQQAGAAVQLGTSGQAVASSVLGGYDRSRQSRLAFLSRQLTC